ncbi:MAG: inorganic phosphate transporter, partial [bacterium]
AGVIWNLGTWAMGIPVSSSHTLIGSILGVGLANGLMTKNDLSGVNWAKATDIGLSLLLSPMFGFCAAAFLLLAMRKIVRDPKLYEPPVGKEPPPRWIRGVLVSTCGAVSFAHGSNDGQKGMGLILLVLIGFMPGYYALDLNHPGLAINVHGAAEFALENIPEDQLKANNKLEGELKYVRDTLQGKSNFSDIPIGDRWKLRQSLFHAQGAIKKAKFSSELSKKLAGPVEEFTHALEYVPFWVILGVALALGVGTTIGYQRIVVTIAEKIGKSHLTYAQGASAEMVAAVTIGVADLLHLPVSTTQVLSSGVAGTMVANRSGVQAATLKKILLAWLLTLPACVSLSGLFYFIGSKLV